ncbi:hypothetical protein B0G80_7233 [Paraburkholderia sp. BL6669N2]|nr:hypothetical protein B0G80_7233 [Paraburkholderia sp. BL6669N2]
MHSLARVAHKSGARGEFASAAVRRRGAVTLKRARVVKSESTDLLMRSIGYTDFSNHSPLGVSSASGEMSSSVC